MEKLCVQKLVFVISVLLFNQVVAQLERTRRGRCEEKAALQAEIRTLRESQEIIHGDIAELKNTMISVTNLLASSLPEDCSAAKARGSWSTTTSINPPGLSPKKVRCEQREQGGGWTVILARRPTVHPLDFNATWQQYKEGFGDMDGEFWLGNEVLHALTKEIPHHLRVVLTDWEGITTTATWHFFTVGSETHHYKLGIREYQSDSTADDALKSHDSHPFSTYDVDNDIDFDHCAQSHGGGWWYFRCYTANPTGVILRRHQLDDHGMLWRTGRKKISLKKIVMMIRPSGPASYSSISK